MADAWSDFWGNVGNGISGWVDDITGKTQRGDKAKAVGTQNTALANAQGTYDQGKGMVGSASDYWNNWMKNPGQAYQATLPQASNAGNAMAGMATNNAVNAARGSGLNAGQAALAGGAQSANAFTQGTLGAQSQMMDQGQKSAQGSAASGTSLQATGLGTQTDIAKQQQDQAMKTTERNDKSMAGLTAPIATAADTAAKGI